jgi:hypothetical protein
MLISPYRLLLTLLCLMALQITSKAQEWITVPLDSPATIDFPVKPEAGTFMGFKTLNARDSGMGYFMMKMHIDDPDAMLPQYSDTVYFYIIQSIREATHTTDLRAHHFMLDSIKGMDITYTAAADNMNMDSIPLDSLNHDMVKAIAAAGNKRLYSHVRLMFVNGTVYNYAFNSPNYGGLLSPKCQKFLESFSLKSWRPLMQNSIKPSDPIPTGTKIGVTANTLIRWIAYLLIIAFVVIMIAFVVHKIKTG